MFSIISHQILPSFNCRIIPGNKPNSKIAQGKYSPDLQSVSVSDTILKNIA
jgi:hypothetical protein